MTKSLLRISVLLLILSGLNAELFADIPPRPEGKSQKLVYDLGEVLSQKQEDALEYKLRYFHDTTSNQILVLTVKSLEGHTAFDYAHTIGETWQVGQKDFDNGIVVLVKPKYGSRDKGQAFIAIGYGLEGAIPDAISKRIVENEMIPYFRNGDYYAGLNQATEVLMALASGEISADGYNQQVVPKGVFGIIPIIVIIIIFLIIRVSSRSYGIGHGGGSIWTALWLGSMLGGSSSGSWKDFSGGSGGFGGGGSGFGGGFGGFGGGSFGGGGAGGSW